MKQILLLLTIIASLLSPLRLAAQNIGEEKFKPANPLGMDRLTNFDSPAWQEAKMFMRGANLGNYLEMPPVHRAVAVSASEFSIMKREGFDHVRVPIGWQHYMGPAPDFTLSPEIFSRVDFAVTNALAAGLAVMINIHHFDELDENPAATTGEFLKIWAQIAAHYQNFPKQLAFELDNEPHANATTVAMNPIYAQAIAQIRQTNPHRTIFVEPGGWGSIGQLKDLVLPPDDNVIVSVHCYEPFYFTHQGATWTQSPVESLVGLQFPGPPVTPFTPPPSADLPQNVLNWIHRYNTLPTKKNPSSPLAFESKFKYIRAWSDYYGRPVHLGEFGCFTRADPASRARFYSAFRHALDQNNIGWAIWDWSAGFRYWDKANNCPVPRMRAALFGK